jgi:integrase
MSRSPLNGRQLFRVAPADFQVFDSYLRNRVTTRECGSIPFIRWPNGHWCIEANLFMDQLQEENKSRRGKGGTLRTRAFYISMLLRFIANRGTSFAKLSDSDFSEFLRLLFEEEEVKKGILRKNRNRTSARQIGCVALDFLRFVSQYNNDPDMLGEFGRIRAYQIQTSTRGGAKSSSKMQWHHRALGVGDPVNYRFPILEDDLQAIRRVASQTTSDFLRKRRQILLSLLDETGMRRMEATMLTVGEVQAAINQMKAGNLAAQQNPELVRMLGPYALTFRTVKHKKISRRTVPVNAIFLQVLEGFLVLRRSFLRRRFNVQRNHPDDPFLVAENSGEALAPNTITQELALLANQAGIVRSCSPHLVRHLYIVRLFVRFILAHEIESKDEFKRLLATSDKFKELVRELSGHASIDALEPYLTLAIDQVTNLKKTLSRVQYQTYADSLAKLNDQLNSSIRSGMSPAEAFAQISKAISALQVPLSDDGLSS